MSRRATLCIAVCFFLSGAAGLRNQVERTLAEIWQRLLGIDRVGIHDNFFELGGNSLLAVQVGARLREVFQVELPPSSFFEATTVAELALLLGAQEPKPAQAAARPAIAGTSRSATAVMTPSVPSAPISSWSRL